MCVAEPDAEEGRSAFGSIRVLLYNTEQEFVSGVETKHVAAETLTL